MSHVDLWNRFKQYHIKYNDLGLQLDISRMCFDAAWLESMADPINAALQAMQKLDQGSIANQDENRMVGHYWLRNSKLAPDETIRSEIDHAINSIKSFTRDIHSGKIKPLRNDGFYIAIVVGIGGSVLGSQFLCHALNDLDDSMLVRFIDNTDPDGMNRILQELEDSLDQTLTIVISKSGGTAETRNAMLEVANAYQKVNLDFSQHAVAITQNDSVLHQKATNEKWLKIFPMWDWVGGRTSVTSAVGLLPIALMGINIDDLLHGACDCDQITRDTDYLKNPAALLALMWHYAGDGQGDRNMVVLPYRDRLEWFPRYLQQLVMESIGKKTDRKGEVVHQGLSVFGNKGSTDQHSFVQQLRDGKNDFFVTFIRTLQDHTESPVKMDGDITSGDYLNAFWLGTRSAMYNAERESITITLDSINAYRLGVLIALFERAVGLYAELIDVNAYHQPGVEAGKKAADDVLALQSKILAHLRNSKDQMFTVEEMASAIGEATEAENILHIMEHIVANPDHRIRQIPNKYPCTTKYGCS